MQSDQIFSPNSGNFRSNLYAKLFDEKSNNGTQKAISRFIVYLILLNLLVLILESAPEIYTANRQLFFIFDLFSISVFSIEYLLRVYLAPEDPEFSGSKAPRLRYIFSVMGLVDLLAILPFFLSLFVIMDTRALRALRMLRILKITYIVGEAIEEFRITNKGRTVRQKVHAILFPSDYGGKLNEVVEMFLIFWIVASVLSIVFESVESIRAQFASHFFILDAISFVVFFIEYSLRVYAYPEENRAKQPLALRFKFMSSISGLLDLVAILPFMLEMLFSNFIDLRFLRIIRMVRLLKLGRYSSASDTMFAVIKKEAPVLMASSFVMGLLVFITAAFGYLLERGAQPDKFENIPQSLYWAVITLASVGYGDISPITPGGRFMTVVLALVGIGIFAIPAAIMASGFTDQLRMNREKLKLDLLKQLEGKEITDELKAEFTAIAKHKHLSDAEIGDLLELAEKKSTNTENDDQQYESLTQIRINPEYALAQYRTLLSKMRELAAIADNAYITSQLQRQNDSTEMERDVWQRVNNGRPR